jgi:hypothetical protein
VAASKQSRPNDDADDNADEWLAVIGRALAFLSLQSVELPDTRLVTRADFLETLGLSRKEAARLLNTTPQSLTELRRQAKIAKGGKRAATRKGTRNRKKK